MPTYEEQELLKNEGNKLFQEKEFDKALAVYTKAIEASPHDEFIAHVLLTNRSACYFQLGSYSAAEEDARAAIRLKNDWARAHERLGLALKAQSKWAAARGAFAKLLRVQPSHTTAKQHLAECSRNVSSARASTPPVVVPRYVSYLHGVEGMPCKVLVDEDADMADERVNTEFEAAGYAWGRYGPYDPDRCWFVQRVDASQADAWVADPSLAKAWLDVHVEVKDSPAGKGELGLADLVRG